MTGKWFKMLDHGQLKVMVENAVDLTASARELSERDRDYYDGYQLTPEEVKALKARKQPPLVINRIKRKVDAMVGIEQRGRSDPRALPRTPKDESAADVATKSLVFVDDQTRFDLKKSLAFENLLVEGYGGVEVIVDQKRGRFDVTINRLRWEEIFFDPYSREKDFSDAAYLGCMKWMALDKAIALYGEQHREIIEGSSASTMDGQTFDDRPNENKNFRWADPTLKRVRVAQMYYLRGGVWHYAIFTGRGEIFNAVSPYLDDDGQPICPMVLMAAYVDRNNQRYGVVRDMIDPQDEVNKRRSKALHLINSRQTMGVRGAVSVATLKAELAKPDGHVEIDADVAMGAREAGIPAFQVLQTTDMAQGNLAMLAEAKQEIDMVGPNAALHGQMEGQQSGRAILAQQNAGLAELAPVYDSLRDWTLRVYRQMWMRIKQYWTDERFVRVTDESGAAEFVGINVMQGFALDPMTGAVVPQVENPVAQMDVDIIIEEAPDLVTLRQEEFQQLAEMRQGGIPIPDEMLIEASSVRNKSRLLELMQEQKQQQAAAMQMQGQAMQAEQQVKGMTAQAKASRDMAEAEKTATETALLQRNAATQEMMLRGGF